MEVVVEVVTNGCSKYSFTPHLMMIMTYCHLQSLCFEMRSMITIVINIKAFKVYIWDLYLKSGFYGGPLSLSIQ